MAERLLILILILCTVLFLPFASVSANEEGEITGAELWRQLNHTSDTILQYIRENRYEEAHQLLDSFSDQFLSIRASDYHLSMSELQVITSVYEEVDEAVVSVSLPHEERVNKAAKLRLLVDVYDKAHQPLWKKTKSSLFEPTAALKSAAEEGDKSKFTQNIEKFTGAYEIVKPAWSVSLKPEEFQQFNALVNYLKNTGLQGENTAVLLDRLNLLEAMLTEIFEGKKEEASDPSLIWVILTIGGAIVTALTYSGWRKYKGEKEEEYKPEKRRNR
jgi:sporulation protein YpjB